MEGVGGAVVKAHSVAPSAPACVSGEACGPDAPVPLCLCVSVSMSLCVSVCPSVSLGVSVSLDDRLRLVWCAAPAPTRLGG
jgi:hypothetical protein